MDLMDWRQQSYLGFKCTQLVAGPFDFFPLMLHLSGMFACLAAKFVHERVPFTLDQIAFLLSFAQSGQGAFRGFYSLSCCLLHGCYLPLRPTELVLEFGKL